MADAFVGLDIGTTSIKAGAFDAEGNELGLATSPTPTQQLPDGGAQYDADELWETAAATVRTVTAALANAGHRPVAIAAASMAESGVLVDAGGQPVGPVIAWFDNRTQPQADWWIEHVGIGRTQRIAAVTPRAVFGAAKMLWIRDNTPLEWAAGQTWLHMADWVAFRLSGVKATDHSLASRTMLFDLSRLEWSDELIHAAGLDASKLAPLVRSGEVVGTVTTEASAATGLPVGTVVGCGGHDHVCAALALGVTEPGTLLDSIGTAESFFLVTDQVDTSGRVAGAGVSQGAHVEPGRTFAMTGLQQGGGRIDARRLELGLGWEAFIGTPEAAAIIDEVAADGERRIAETLAATGASNIRHIVTGGASLNAALIERKREISGRHIEVAEVTQATVMGAAVLARRAASRGQSERTSS